MKVAITVNVRRNGAGVEREERAQRSELQWRTGTTGQAAAGRALREERSGGVRAWSLYADQLGAQAWSGRRTCPGREHAKSVLQDQAQGTAMTPTGRKESRLSRQMNR